MELVSSDDSFGESIITVPITYFRSSSYSTHEGCEARYLIEYVLGWRGLTNVKTERGTIVHRVLEILGILKKAQQDGLGGVLLPDTGPIELDYKCNIDSLVDSVFGYHTNKVTHINWTKEDLDICHELVNKAITWNDGIFNPLNRVVVEPELHFDFEIDEDWAKYEYEINGEKIKGNLALKGTLDFTTDIGNNTIEYIDWKTGRLWDWNKNKAKDYTTLQSDNQLLIYFYALTKLFPGKSIVVTIFFINDGGPFSICFGKSDIKKVEDMLRRKFEYIKATKVPKLNRGYHCKAWCPCGKSTFEETGVKSIQEFRSGQIANKGNMMTKCDQISFEIGRKGIDRTINEYTNKGHDVDGYNAPGLKED